MYLLSLHLTEHISMFPRILCADRLRRSGIDSQIPNVNLRIMEMPQCDIIKTCIQQLIFVQRNVGSIPSVQQQDLKYSSFFAHTPAITGSEISL